MSHSTNAQASDAESTPLPVFVFTVAEAATVARCSEASILRALAATDPGKYPPPLAPIGRHGQRGQYLITPEELWRWVGSLAKFLD